MGRLGTRSQTAWGFLGAGAAAWFAVWMLFFPQYVPTHFAWDVQPRFAQVFIGAGYIFRTVFFLNVAFERDWLKLRWMVWGNLVFTGVLLFATYWHADEFLWNPFVSPVGHLWIVLYIFEPILMLYLLPPGILRATAPPTGGLILPLYRRFLIFVAGLLLMFGLLPFVNPEFAEARWPWQLNGLDARMISAWYLGWAAWCGTMAFAADWDEIRTAARLFVLNGVALIAVSIIFRSEFLPGRGSAAAFTIGLAVMTGVMAAFHVLQERRRPLARATAAPTASSEPAASTSAP
jgi:hypothetical protein